jgi:fatty acid amide hydrolase
MSLWQLSAAALSSMLARGEVGAREVLLAHLDRIAAVDGRVRAFTEVLREQALADADDSDARRRRGEARGPLDGVPLAFKECFDIAGRATTLGLPSWRGRIADRDAAMVTLLREAGAVVLGRTNLSQTILFVESRNPIFGQTANPWSLARSPGGSSGGTAAAVAAGMVPLGLGTDLGGSIRIPAHFCAICGIKPTLDRLPMRGYRSVLAGQEVVRGMGGPMARTTADLALFFRAIEPRRASQLDPRVPPLSWEDADAVRLEGLRVGFYVDDGVLPASRAIARAVHRAADALQAHGCEVCSFQPPAMHELLEAYFGGLSADGGQGVLAALAGGEVDPVLEPLRRLARVPARARRVLVSVTRAFGQDGLALMLGAIGEKTVTDLWQLTDRLRAYRTMLLGTLDAQKIDLLVCPPFATCALQHGASKSFMLASSYSILFNATQLPAGTVPVTRVRPGETARPSRRDVLERHAAAVDQGSAGLPVGVQIVGRPWCDHVVLAAMRAVEAEATRDAEFPATPIDPRD